MLLKLGIDISRLNREIRRALNVVNVIYEELDCELVITSAYEGNHSAGSLHYANDAFDIRHCPAKDGTLVVARLRNRLGSDFDVVEEGTHIHIEYDPK